MTSQLCYRCGVRPPMTYRTICGACTVELREKRDKSPLKETCTSCGLRFINDWERMKHEIVGAHHYRAWDPQDGKAGMVARKPQPPPTPLTDGAEATPQEAA